MYSAGVGICWLVVADGHWSYVTTVDAGSAPPISSSLAPAFATVTWAAGELPWAVTVGERAMQLEAGALALEMSPTDLSWSRARDLTPDEVSRAFKKRALPRPK